MSGASSGASGASRAAGAFSASKPRDVASRAKASRANESRARSSRAASSRALPAKRTPNRRAVASVASGSVTKSAPGGFVDARGLKADRAVSERLALGAQDGPIRRPKVIGFKDRVKEERRARRVTLLIRSAIVVGVIALVSTLVWLLFFSPVLKLQADRIVVEGANEWVSVDEVSAVAMPQVDRSLLIVSSSDIASELKGMPGVTSAEVTKNWPHGLTIAVSAQKPAAVLRASDGTLTAVDSQARVLNAVGASVAGIPVIDVDTVASGLDNKAVQQALQVLASLPESMRQRVSQVTAKTQDSVTTVLDGGKLTIVWGDSSQLELKKAEVDKIINDPNVIGDKHQVNVSSPRKPIIK